MKTTAPTTPIQHEDALRRAERLLVEAGFSFTVVDRCPEPACEVCAARTVPAAA